MLLGINNLWRMRIRFSDEIGLLWEQLFPKLFPTFCHHVMHLHLRRDTVGRSPHVSVSGLKRFLSIFSDFIFDSSVDRGMPNLAAAPIGPNTRLQLALGAPSIMFFSCSSSLRSSSIGFSVVAITDGCGCRGSQLSSIENVSVSQRITERTTTF